MFGFRRLFAKRKFVWTVSVASSLLLLTICYFIDNLPIRFISGPSVGQKIEQAKRLLDIADEKKHEEYLLVNIAYDRELVPVCDNYGFPMGEIDITNRAKLNAFLSELKGTHRYVIVDVLLSDRYVSESDSSLVRTLLDCDRIIISKSETTNLIDSSLCVISGSVDYMSHLLESNFVKYDFLKDGELTLPYIVSKTLYCTPEMTSFGPFYFSRGRLNWRCLNLKLPIKNPVESTPAKDDQIIEHQVLNLGSDVLDMDIDVSELVRDKIVVIGDFDEDDIHDTYLGRLPGPIININAIEALRNEDHIIPWTLILYLLILYSTLTYIIIQNKTLKWKKFTRFISGHSLLKLLLSFIGFSFIIALIACSVYFIFGKDINVIVPSLWYTGLHKIASFWREQKSYN